LEKISKVIEVSVPVIHFLILSADDIPDEKPLCELFSFLYE